MAKRTTNINAVVEYLPDHKDRTTKLNAVVEYLPDHKDRTTKIVAVVEYTPITATVRVFGPALQ